MDGPGDSPGPSILAMRKEVPMKREILASLIESELDLYAKTIGVELPDGMPICEKVDRVEEARNRTAVVSVLGFDVSVPIKSLHDKRVADKVKNLSILSDDAMETLFVDIVGDDQWDAIVEHCTDDDGVVDVDALGLFIAKVLVDPELKNF